MKYNHISQLIVDKTGLGKQLQGSVSSNGKIILEGEVSTWYFFALFLF